MTLLSIMGLYQFDSSIFEAMALPDGIDRDIVTAQILTECAELEIVLPDPDVFRVSLGFWSRSQLPIWTKLYESTQFEYNPIWNKDGTITETRHLETDDTETRNLSKTNTETRNLSKTNTETRNLASSADTTATGKTAGYNSSTFQNQDQTVSNGTGTDTGTVSNNGSDTGTVGNNGSDTGTVNNTGEHDETVTRRETGNIGVTTTQQMIREEREINQFDIYKYIVQSFKYQYCLGVY